jgi:hypothetical protein
MGNSYDIHQCTLGLRKTAAALILTINFARGGAAQVVISVDTTQQGVTNSLCSLQEAIYASELKNNIAISSTDPDTFYTTGCNKGTGNGDTISLLPGAVFVFTHPWDGDAHNSYGPTATPVIFRKMTIEGNGATLQWMDTFSPGNSRLFAIGTVNDPNLGSGTGDLTIRNVYIKDFHIKGGNGGYSGGGGGLGAGGAIYNVGTLSVENSTFEDNGAVGGNGHHGSGGGSGDGGGGGGLSGAGGDGCYLSGGGGGGSRGDGGTALCSSTGVLGGAGGGGTVFRGGQSTIQRVGGPGGFLCGGNGGDPGNNGHAGCTDGGGGGGGGAGSNSSWCFLVGSCYSEGGSGSYGGGGGGGVGNGGHGGFGGGGGSGAFAFLFLSGGDGGFGGGGGSAAPSCGCFSSAGKGGPYGGHADDAGHGGGGGALGGAIFNHSGSLTVRNSTFFNNFVYRGDGGGGSADKGADAGGAIFSLDNNLEITNSTFSNNRSTASGAAVVVYKDVGGAGPVNFILNNTIFANNGSDECFYTGKIDRLKVKGAGNLIMNNGSGGKFAPCPGVAALADPQLLPLQLNSPGNTPTMAILRISSAFNAADSGTSLPTDQRGVARPQLGGFDIGAYEALEPGIK